MSHWAWRVQYLNPPKGEEIITFHHFISEKKERKRKVGKRIKQIFTFRVTEYFEYLCSAMAVLCSFSPYTLFSFQFRSSPSTHLDLSEVFVSALQTLLSSHLKIWPSIETYNSSWESYRYSYTQQHITYSRRNNGHPHLCKDVHILILRTVTMLW